MSNASPLTSLRVLDFSTLLPGPYASMLLADIGADVLRIESPTRVDLTRHLPPMHNGESAAHLQLNRNKRSLALDLKKPSAKAIVHALLKDYDILIEQFRPGVMQRLGLDYESLRAINPSLIYCAITGYGQTGPWKDRAGHDINYLALSGQSAYGGFEASGPAPQAIQIADIAGGSHHAVMGILSAVIERQHTGQGQLIDISMTDAAFALNGMSGAGALLSGQDPKPEAGLLNGGSFYGHYQTADGKYLAVGGLEPQFCQALAQALERPELASMAKLHDAAAQGEAKQQLQQIFKQKTQSEWVEFLEPWDVCIEPVLTPNEAAQHPQLVAREMSFAAALGDGSQVRQMACPIRFNNTQQPPPSPAPSLGADSQTVLASLGYSEAQIQQLIDDGTVATNKES